jgi:hypothetical protein
VTRQVRDPDSVQQENINRLCATENSNSSRLTLSGDRPSDVMNQWAWFGRIW